jgi:hypothetical protein
MTTRNSHDFSETAPPPPPSRSSGGKLLSGDDEAFRSSCWRPC